jgi:heptosyltransferase-3
MHFDKSKTSSVVVLMPDKHMGNLIVSLSSIAALEESFAGSRFLAVVDERYRDIAESLLEGHKLLFFPGREIKSSAFLNKITLFFTFVGHLRSARADLVVDLHGGRTSGLLSFLSGSRFRAGHTRAQRPFLYNLKIDLSDMGHKVFNYIEIAGIGGSEYIATYRRLRATVAGRDSLLKKMGDSGIMQGKPLVSIHAGAGKLHKQWTSRGFAGISDWLSSAGFQVIFVGSIADIPKTDEILSISKPGPHNLADKLTLAELMTLFEMSSLFIGNDSGPMHLAAAMGTPLVAFFGPSDEKRWGPLSPRSVVLRGDARCRVCLHEDCPDGFKCITSLKPGEVKSAVEKLLGPVGAG